MFFQSLKTKIAVSFALLLLITVFLMDFVVVSIVEHNLILARINQARHRLSRLSELVDDHTIFDVEAFPDDVVGFAYACFGKRSGYSLARLDADIRVSVRRLTRHVKMSGSPQVRYAGDTWGVFLKQKKFLIVSDPLKANDRVVGASTLVIDLDGLYQTLRKSQKNVLLYMVVNLVLVLILGSYRMSRLVFKPIYKMIKITKGYSETEPLYFLPQKRHHEFNMLSTALNQMMRRIEADRDRLKTSLESLRAANAELKKAQNDIIRAEKLASVGRLAAGIAHEIGNPIGMVLGYLGLLRKNSIAPSDSAGKDYIDRAESEINRINLIIRQLLDFSRVSTAQPVPLSVHEIIKNTVEGMMHHPIMANIDITCQFSASTDRVYGDPDRLRQVLLNLLINAADSISASMNRLKGEIRLMTETEAADKDHPLLRLMVADNGTGISKEDIDNIFDPFYTTKEPGKGTGLGLSVSYMIIEQMGGNIFAESETGKGTTVIINLPLCDGEPAED